MKRLYHIILAIALSSLAVISAWGQQKVEYFWDTDPGVGKGQVLQNFTGSEAVVSVSLDASNLSAGIHHLGLRAMNDGHFSATYYRSFYVPPQVEKITRIEYAWDTDPALGSGTALTFTSGSTVDLTQDLSVSGLTAGMHTLYIRALSTGHHSQTYTRSFYVPPTVYRVNAIEYFFDKDPGVGRATRMAASMEDDALTMAFDVNTDGLSEGIHQIGIRTLTEGTWSATKVRQFLVRSVVENEIVRLEYFWDNDPGIGKAIDVALTPGKEVTVNFDADMRALEEGNHILGLRAQSSSGGWSTTELIYDILFSGMEDDLQNYLNSLHDTEDALAGNTYTRQFLNTDWQALYVPFSLTYSDWSDKFEVASLSRFCQYDDDADGETERQELEAVILRSASDVLKANTPYLIRAKESGTYNIPVDASKIVAEKVNTVTYNADGASMSVTGNYSSRNGLKSAALYRLMGGSLFVPTSDDEALPPYRWYATIETPDKQSKVRIKFVGNTTGIETLPTSWDEDTIGNFKVYDLQGRRVIVSSDTKISELPKGVYIINNKKYIVK